MHYIFVHVNFTGMLLVVTLVNPRCWLTLAIRQQCASIIFVSARGSQMDSKAYNTGFNDGCTFAHEDSREECERALRSPYSAAEALLNALTLSGVGKLFGVRAVDTEGDTTPEMDDAIAQYVCGFSDGIRVQLDGR